MEMEGEEVPQVYCSLKEIMEHGEEYIAKCMALDGSTKFKQLSLLNKLRDNLSMFEWCLYNFHNIQHHEIREYALEAVVYFLSIQSKRISIIYYEHLTNEFFTELLEDDNYKHPKLLDQIWKGQILMVNLLYPRIWIDFYKRDGRGLFSFPRERIYHYLRELNLSMEDHYCTNRKPKDVIPELYKNNVPSTIITWLEDQYKEDPDQVCSILSGIKWMNVETLLEFKYLSDLIENILNHDVIKFFCNIFEKIKDEEYIELRLSFLQQYPILSKIQDLVTKVEWVDDLSDLACTILSPLISSEFCTNYYDLLLTLCIKSLIKRNSNLMRCMSYLVKKGLIETTKLLDILFAKLQQEFDNPNRGKVEISFRNFFTIISLIPFNKEDKEARRSLLFSIFDNINVKQDMERTSLVLKSFYKIEDLKSFEYSSFVPIVYDYFAFILDNDPIFSPFYHDSLIFYGYTMITLYLSNRKDETNLPILKLLDRAFTYIKSFPDEDNSMHIFVSKILNQCRRYLVKQFQIINIISDIYSLLNPILSNGLKKIIKILTQENKSNFSNNFVRFLFSLNPEELMPQQIKAILIIGKYIVNNLMNQELFHYMMVLKDNVNENDRELYLETLINIFGTNAITFLLENIPQPPKFDEEKMYYSLVKINDKINITDEVICNNMIHIFEIVTEYEQHLYDEILKGHHDRDRDKIKRVANHCGKYFKYYLQFYLNYNLVVPEELKFHGFDLLIRTFKFLDSHSINTLFMFLLQNDVNPRFIDITFNEALNVFVDEVHKNKNNNNHYYHERGPLKQNSEVIMEFFKQLEESNTEHFNKVFDDFMIQFDDEIGNKCKECYGKYKEKTKKEKRERRKMEQKKIQPIEESSEDDDI